MFTSKKSCLKYGRKWAFALFLKKYSIKCPIFETIYKGNAPILKLDFLKIEFQFKTRFLDNRVIANQKIIFFFLKLEFLFFFLSPRSL